MQSVVICCILWICYHVGKCISNVFFFEDHYVTAKKMVKVLDENYLLAVERLTARSWKDCQ